MTETTPHFVLFGTDTGKGISRATWNPDTGEIGAIELHRPSPHSNYFAFHPTAPVVYVTNELTGGKATVSAFRISGEKLTPLQQVACDDGPCYISCDAHQLYVANYAGGSFEAWSFAPDGAIHTHAKAAIRPAKFTKPGPVPDRQDNPHFHCAILSPDDKYVLVCNLGADEILTIPTSAPGTFTMTPTRPGSGPRHVAFHPNGRWMYCIHELDCTIDLYDWHDGKLTANPLAPLSTLPAGVSTHGNTACELLISPDGQFAYACTRGTDDISTYRIDQTTGAFTELQRLPAGGKTPRILTFDPSRRWLIACNQAEPGSVAVFAHDPATAKLTLTHTYAAPTPMCVAWI